MDRLSELLGQAVQFVYTCWDRIVLSGYIERLQRPEIVAGCRRRRAAATTQYPAVTAGYHLNKRHWNTVELAGSDPPTSSPSGSKTRPTWRRPV